MTFTSSESFLAADSESVELLKLLKESFEFRRRCRGSSGGGEADSSEQLSMFGGSGNVKPRSSGSSEVAVVCDAIKWTLVS